jgi:hypothetical protein
LHPGGSSGFVGLPSNWRGRNTRIRELIGKISFKISNPFKNKST